MRLHAAGFIFCQIIAHAEQFGVLPNISHDSETLEVSESRYHPSDYDYPDYARKESDLSVTFQAPRYEAHDYWRHKSGYDNRRTFYEDDKSAGFYQFVTSFFGGKDEVTNAFRHHPPTPPYPFETPFGFRPTEPNYIPPPKPIRASVIKLETLTRAPDHPSFQYRTTPKYYPDVGTILNHVLIENSKTQRFEDHVPDFKPLPVLPKPVHVPSTTLRASHIRPNDRTVFHGHNVTDYKYPASVQDQLPHLDLEDVRIPYVPEKSIPQIFDALPTQPSTIGIRFPTADPEATTNVFGIDPKTPKSFPGVVEKIRRPFRPKKVLPDKSSVEMIANLTVEGLSKFEKGNVNLHGYANHFNVKNLIGYEMSKLGNTSRKNLNLNDELSLDAKILKDTNWDGLGPTTATITAPTIPTTPTTQTSQTTTTVQSKKTKIFWEIDDLTTTTKQPTTEDINLQTTTTTEFVPGETTELFTTEPTTQEMRPRSDAVETTKATETTTPRRRYSRRPKILSFTPYPTTADEFQKKTINRSHFPKRQKPNITLAFGNVLRISGKDEVMKFSDEDSRKRKAGKRRQGYRRKRLSTAQPSTESQQEQ